MKSRCSVNVCRGVKEARGSTTCTWLSAPAVTMSPPAPGASSMPTTAPEPWACAWRGRSTRLPACRGSHTLTWPSWAPVTKRFRSPRSACTDVMCPWCPRSLRDGAPVPTSQILAIPSLPPDNTEPWATTKSSTGPLWPTRLDNSALRFVSQIRTVLSYPPENANFNLNKTM